MRRFQKVLCIIGFAAIFGASAPLTKALAQAQSAGPALPPAEYKALPVDTRVYYHGWSFQILKSDGLDIQFKTNDRRWGHFYALFGLQGDDMYEGGDWNSRLTGDNWVSSLDGKARSALEGLWPLKVGNTAKYVVDESRPGFSWFQSMAVVLRRARRL